MCKVPLFNNYTFNNYGGKYKMFQPQVHDRQLFSTCYIRRLTFLFLFVKWVGTLVTL